VEEVEKWKKWKKWKCLSVKVSGKCNELVERGDIVANAIDAHFST